MSIIDVLEEEGRRLDSVISMAMEDLRKAPDGSLDTRMASGAIRFFLNKEGSDRPVYLSRKKDPALIRALAQKKYARRMLREACRQKLAIDRFLADYNPQALTGIAEDLMVADLISPYIEETEEIPSSINPQPEVDLDLISQMLELCSRILNKTS